MTGNTLLMKKYFNFLQREHGIRDQVNLFQKRALVTLFTFLYKQDLDRLLK